MADEINEIPEIEFIQIDPSAEIMACCSALNSVIDIDTMTKSDTELKKRIISNALAVIDCHISAMYNSTFDVEEI